MGWASVAEVTRAIEGRAGFSDLLQEDVERLAAGWGAARFELNGDRIRARYGHTIRVTLGYPSTLPPKYLFHGTSIRVLSGIRSMGLISMRRHFVHLASDPEYSEIVGQKNGSSSVLLRVTADNAARQADVRFYRASDVVWLSEPVPPEFVELVLVKSGEVVAQLSPEKEVVASMRSAIADLFTANEAN